MPTLSEHDRDLIRRIRAGSARGALVADDPTAIAAELASGSAVVVVDPADLPHAVAAARVRVAEVVVARARRAEPEAYPAVRAAEAHLRRQHAAWKVGWWARDQPVPDLATWSPQVPAATAITLLAVDLDGVVDVGADATMTATGPAAVRVVVLRARA